MTQHGFNPLFPGLEKKFYFIDDKFRNADKKKLGKLNVDSTGPRSKLPVSRVKSLLRLILRLASFGINLSALAALFRGHELADTEIKCMEPSLR